jgi:hypothetical protein
MPRLPESDLEKVDNHHYILSIRRSLAPQPEMRFIHLSRARPLPGAPSSL